MIDRICELLGDAETKYLLGHKCETFPKERLYLPGPEFVDRVFIPSHRSPHVLTNLQRLFSHGRLCGTGFLSILPVDQGVEHSAGASFAPSPDYFDPENIIRLAIEGGCNAVVSTFGVLGSVARRYAYKIPMIVKINHNELLSYPNQYDQVLFGGGWIERSTWEQPRSAQRSILAPPNHGVKLSRSAKCLLAVMNSAWD